MKKQILFCDQEAIVSCDEKCNKAWGINGRPSNPDGTYLKDEELGDAPVNPETYEGDDAKPTSKEQMGNKWCVRECERCNMERA
jgi:hypothetical protein